MSRVPTLAEFAAIVATVAPRRRRVGGAARLGDDLELDSFDLVRLDALLFERHGGGLGLSRSGVDWLALTVGEAYELCVDRELVDHHEGGADG